jgi:hypothetical protein
VDYALRPQQRSDLGPAHEAAIAELDALELAAASPAADRTGREFDVRGRE